MQNMTISPPRVHETPQASKDKMQVNSLRLGLFFVVSFTSFLIILMVPSLCQNPSFGLWEGFSESKVVRGISQKVKTELLIEEPNDTTNGDEPEGRDKRNNIFKSSESDEKVKLLDGLLVSGFEEGSCISRLQSHLYRKSSPHKPSPYLISKLRRYEEIHRKCGPNSKAYNRDMTNIAHSNAKNKSATTMCNYIFWAPVQGLGNQIISMVSTFLYALLTDRVMLVKFGKDKHNLFCEPFLNSTWLLPENYHFGRFRKFQSIVDEGIIGKISQEDLPSILFVDLRFHSSYPNRYFHCDHGQDFLSKVPLLILIADQYFVPSLFMTPVFEKELNKMFPEIDTIFHHLGRYLFHPSNEAWGQITSLYKAHFAKADEKIGLQIRVYEWSTTPQKLFMDQILNCTIHNKILPQVGMQNSVYSSSGNKAVLVASLSPEYGADLRAMYQNKSTVTGEVIDVYQPSHEKHQKFEDKEQNMKAWVEMYLLSLSDVLVTTFQSTFGYVAKGLGTSRAWLLYKAKDTDEVPFPACEQELLLEPCYHAPPYQDCNGDFIQDFTSSFPYITHCKDYPFGVKLMNGSIYM